MLVGVIDRKNSKFTKKFPLQIRSFAFRKLEAGRSDTLTCEFGINAGES